MIYVNGVPFPADSSSGHDMVISVLEHPDLVSASRSFCAIPERKVSVSEVSVQAKSVYVFQREYATVDPSLVEIAGTDEATTCVGMVIRNCKTGMTSIGHLDSPDVVDVGIFQMMSLVSDSGDNDDIILDVHLVGAFEDCAPQGNPMEGYSFPLCMKIVEHLAESIFKFEIKIFQVLKHNTRRDSKENAYPIFHGLAVETSTGSVIPASFDASTRCPDDIIRRIRLSASFEDPRQSGRLLDTYETQTDRIVIRPFSWSNRLIHRAAFMRHLSDLEILQRTSTSPSAEGPDYVDNQKRVWRYLIRHPDWRQAFPSKLARVFERVGNSWVMTSERLDIGMTENQSKSMMGPETSRKVTRIWADIGLN